MGSFNISCSVTGLPITDNEKCYLIFVVDNTPLYDFMGDKEDFMNMHSSHPYSCLSKPIPVEYDDCGGFKWDRDHVEVDKCKDLREVVEVLQKHGRLKDGTTYNKVNNPKRLHYTEVHPQYLTNPGSLIEYIHDDDLYIYKHSPMDPTPILCPVKFWCIRKNVLDTILKSHCIESWFTGTAHSGPTKLNYNNIFEKSIYGIDDIMEIRINESLSEHYDVPKLTEESKKYVKIKHYLTDSQVFSLGIINTYQELFTDDMQDPNDIFDFSEFVKCVLLVNFMNRIGRSIQLPMYMTCGLESTPFREFMGIFCKELNDMEDDYE